MKIRYNSFLVYLGICKAAELDTELEESTIGLIVELSGIKVAIEAKYSGSLSSLKDLKKDPMRSFFTRTSAFYNSRYDNVCENLEKRLSKWTS